MYCNKCMNEIPDGSNFCRECMADNVTESMSHHLKPGTILNRKYVVGSAIGEGGFGITYVGRDTTLDIKIAIKEYYPNGYVNRSHELSNTISTTTENQKEFFDKGKERFLGEARSLAKFNQEKGIVDVRDYFEENGTAYIIMEYMDGVTLSDYIKQNGVMDPTTTFTLMKPVMHSLQKVHDKGIIHRDISPDNIMFLRNGTLKLMDFGAARYFLNQNNMMSVVLKMGYAPEEQYRKNGHQGPWTDVYGLCATMYRCITGRVPEEALDRIHADNIQTPSQLGIAISRPLEETLMYGLAVHKENRCQSMNELMMNVDKAFERSYVPYNTTHQVQADVYKTQAADDDFRTQAADPDDTTVEQNTFNSNYGYMAEDAYTGPANQNPHQNGYGTPNAYNGQSNYYQPEGNYNQQGYINQQGGYTAPVNYDQNYHNGQNGYNQPIYNHQNGYTQPENYYQQQNYGNQPQNYGTQQQKPQKNYTTLIVIVSICLVAVIACAVIVAVVLGGNTFGSNDSDTNNPTSVSQDNIVSNDTVVMINCINSKYADAKKSLEDMGLSVKVEYKFDNYYTQDTVCGQSVNTGDSLSKGDTVTLYVSKGPDKNPDNYDQKVVVSASSGTSSGKLKLYNWENGSWKEAFSCKATVGKSGISSNYGEGISATPKGTFKLGYLISTSNIGQSDWPFYQATQYTCIVDDTSSSLYNQIKEYYNLPAGTGYDQLGKNLTNGNCSGLLFIEHNGNGASSAGVVRGNGSAITICGMNSGISSTYGCIDIKSDDFYTLMANLDYSKNPHIEITN